MDHESKTPLSAAEQARLEGLLDRGGDRFLSGLSASEREEALGMMERRRKAWSLPLSNAADKSWTSPSYPDPSRPIPRDLAALDRMASKKGTPFALNRTIDIPFSSDAPGLRSADSHLGRSLPLEMRATGKVNPFDPADLPLRMRGGKGGGGGDEGAGDDPGGRVRRVFVVNWPKAFGGAGVGGIGAPGTGGGGAADKKPEETDTGGSRTRALMAMLGADPMMMSVMGGSRFGRFAVGLQTMGRQLQGVAGSDNPFDVAGGALGAVGTAGLMMGGPVGGTVAAIALLGATAAKAVGGLMSFGQNLLKSNFAFAEFSGAMTNVQVQQEIRDIYHGMRTGNARAATAAGLAEANESLRFALEPVRNSLANLWNNASTTMSYSLLGIANILGLDGENGQIADEQQRQRLLGQARRLAGVVPGLPQFLEGLEHLAGRGRNMAGRQNRDGGDAGGLMPWITNPVGPLGRDDMAPNAPPRAWEEDWNRPRRFSNRGPQ